METKKILAYFQELHMKHPKESSNGGKRNPVSEDEMWNVKSEVVKIGVLNASVRGPGVILWVRERNTKGKFIWLVSWTCLPSVLRMALTTIGTLPRCPRDGFTSLRLGTQLHSGRERELERESTFDLWMYLSHALRMALPVIRHWLTLGMNLPLSDSRLMSMLLKQGGRKEFLQMSGVINQVLTHWIPSPRCHLGTVVGQVTPCPGSMPTIHLSLDKVLWWRIYSAVD